MKKPILLITLLIATMSLSCYDGLLDTQNTIYKLRDIGPAGGLIFYVNPNYEKDGWRYLEAAPYDQSTNSNWSTNTSNLANGISPLPPDLGKGSTNTDAIIFQNSGGASAAKICRDYSNNGYKDWFLPSKDELDLMCWNLKGKRHFLHPEYITDNNPDVPNAATVGVGGFSSGVYYLSSSENNPSDIHHQDFTGGWQGPIAKTNAEHVRAIRAF